jgi:hypothetical protein
MDYNFNSKGYLEYCGSRAGPTYENTDINYYTDIINTYIEINIDVIILCWNKFPTYKEYILNKLKELNDNNVVKIKMKEYLKKKTLEEKISEFIK